jgi:non-canonical (house-cleaning) NTP pyrophosphatase
LKSSGGGHTVIPSFAVGIEAGVKIVRDYTEDVLDATYIVIEDWFGLSF